ncbi:uncharacterized protein [Temnothorax longispinosus]|uniref:uncharacterized protein n=1 Tax=Temnothorax longispinosus TaxID=300112 RepID=UPI003A9918EA
MQIELANANANLNEGYVRDISQIHLPKISIPTFSGSYKNWYPFYNTFESMIHLNQRLTNIQRFHYLISSLEGDAAHVIKSLEITSNKYQEALDLLKQRYDDKRMIAQEHIRALYDLPAVTRGNSIALRNLIDDVLRHLRSLKTLGRPTEHWDDLIIHLIITKLDSSIVKEWEDDIRANDMPTLKQLTDFLTHKCKALAAVFKKSSSDSVTSNSCKTNKVNTHVATSNIGCAYCKGKHYIFQCPDFLKLLSENRNKEVRAKHLCINCLRSTTHQARDCKSSTCQTCSKKHNTLLHIEDKSNKDNATTNKPDQASQSSAVTLNHHISQDKYCQIILSTASINVYDQRGNIHVCRALLDSGSQSSFITGKLASKLNLVQKQTNMSVTGINKSQTHSCSTVIIRIKSMHTSYSQNIECYVLNTITENLPQIQVNTDKFKIPSNIRLADPHFHIPGEINILIGAEIFWQLMCVGQIHSHKNQPTLQKTQLGWIVGGKTCTYGPAEAKVCNLSTNQQINETLAKFWNMEHIPEETPFSPEEKLCMEYFEKTTTRNEDGRFIVQLPIKETKLQQLGESRSTALKRFIAMERKLQRQPQLKAQYVQFMSEYLALGHMVRTDEQQIPQHTPRYYIPHHYVLKDSSLTTKLRVVFDASCDTSTGISLNDCLMVGPTLQQDLFMILLRFRTFAYVITADITQMYRQVLIDEAQICLQMIFWRNDPKDEITLFALLTVIYGSASAAFLAIASTRKIAALEKTNYPIGAATILDNFYVDDLLSGADTIAGVKRIRDETTKVLNKAGFQLRKWASNCPEVLEDMPHADTGEPIHFINRNEEICTLGMHWNTTSDNFKYDINTSDSRKVTKRSMLSALSKIFDPLGLLGPITLVAKILIQRVWRLNLAWDETVPIDIHTAWLQFQDQLSIIHDFTIPRYILCKQTIRIQIHGFADASERAYGACIYIRITNPQDLALELSAAVLLAQQADKILNAVRLEIEDVCYWTDSEIVLHWIRGTDKRWSVFVANRVGEIHRLSRPTKWYHVSTEFNPADYVSRGALPTSLSNARLWWSGPSWLQHESQDWNTNIPPPLEEIPEQRRAFASTVSTDDKSHEHRKQLHAGAQATLAAVRAKYWPLAARNSIKKHIRQCITCFKAAPRTSETIMNNGTNFQGAANSLKEFYQMLHNKHHQDRVDTALKEDNIEWSFIPPHAPHFGGIWEAAVKSANNHLKRVVGDAALNFEGMCTVLAQIEAVLNSRPHPFPMILTIFHT